MKKPTLVLSAAALLSIPGGVLAELPHEVEALTQAYREKREETIVSATKALDAEYTNRMKALQDRYTKSGRLEDALRVDSLLKMSTLKSKATGQWLWSDSGRILTLAADGSAKLTEEDSEMAWSVTDANQIRLFFVSSSYQVTFDDAIQTASAEKRGTNIKAKLTRKE